jgi:hypothetical protein
MDIWQLPVKTKIGGADYDLHTDFRDILEIFAYLQNPDLPEPVRWRIALGLFYEQPVMPEHRQEALAYLSEFLRCGAPNTPGPRLLDWQHDAGAIIAGVNKAAGQELRSLPFVHWWSFLGWFHAMEPGQLSALVSIRDRLRRGKPLEDWQKEFYAENKAAVDLPVRYTAAEQQHRQQLLALLKEPPH